MGQRREDTGVPVLEKQKGYAGDVAFVTDGVVQTHLAQRDLGAGFATGQIVNLPLIHIYEPTRPD